LRLHCDTQEAKSYIQHAHESLTDSETLIQSWSNDPQHDVDTDSENNICVKNHGVRSDNSSSEGSRKEACANRTPCRDADWWSPTQIVESS
jgi:hypothetical protein